MPEGHREKSFRSRPSQRSTPTLVTSAMVARLMSRRSRSRRKRGPNVSRSDMGEPPREQFARRGNPPYLRGSFAYGAPAPSILVIAGTRSGFGRRNSGNRRVPGGAFTDFSPFPPVSRRARPLLLRAQTSDFPPENRGR